MGFENESTLTTFINKREPMDYKTCPETGRIVYRCHNNFGSLDVKRIPKMVPQFVDFGLAARLDREQLGILPIQPDHYRAPEVILGCGWNSKTDIWNMGVLVGISSVRAGEAPFFSSPAFVT